MSGDGGKGMKSGHLTFLHLSKVTEKSFFCHGVNVNVETPHPPKRQFDVICGNSGMDVAPYTVFYIIFTTNSEFEVIFTPIR